ncbi:MAG: molybdate ABC transporter substrate-binding protein [Spirochaetes bacterium]|nr:molybdate ABC transporter substrate-binding protein [Spirochaetota bacterium]
MKKILTLMLIITMTAACTKKNGTVELTVSAAASLKNTMEETKAAYEKANPGTAITVNYASSGSLQHQIEEGAPVDVFISASPKQINALKEKSLLEDSTITQLYKNSIVLIVPLDSDISGFNDLSGEMTGKLALGEPASVPAGQYAMEVLVSLKLADTVKNRTVFAKDVREVLTWVESGNADAGIVYRTDAMISSKVKMAAQAPEGSHKPVIYPGAVIKTSPNMKPASEFLKWLSTDKDAVDIFTKYGFSPVN